MVVAGRARRLTGTSVGSSMRLSRAWALYKLSNTFSDSKVARQIRTVAVGTLNVSIPALQSQLKQ